MKKFARDDSAPVFSFLLVYELLVYFFVDCEIIAECT